MTNTEFSEGALILNDPSFFETVLTEVPFYRNCGALKWFSIIAIYFTGYYNVLREGCYGKQQKKCEHYHMPAFHRIESHIAKQF